MTDNKLIKVVNMDCPLCDKVHDVEMRSRVSQALIKGERVAYEEQYYHCNNVHDDEPDFTTGKMLNENLLRARNSYRKGKGLLTSDEIVDIRNIYGLSQVDLSKLMGWGEATISRYESKQIQDESYDNMLRLIKDDPMKALEFLEKNRDKFDEDRFIKIKGNIKEKVEQYGKEYISRQALVAQYIDYDSESIYNGNSLLDIDKVEAVIAYFASRIKKLYKVKLMKMLWYSDSLSYKIRNKAITGLVYYHYDMGSLPIGHRELMNLEKLNVVEEQGQKNNIMIHICPSPKVEVSVLSDEDIEILDEVIDKFKKYNANQIVEYMHEEEAYTNTDYEEIIPFSLAKKIREF